MELLACARSKAAAAATGASGPRRAPRLSSRSPASPLTLALLALLTLASGVSAGTSLLPGPHTDNIRVRTQAAASGNLDPSNPGSGASRSLQAAKRGKASGRKPTPHSRYVSVGQVRPFTGDVAPAPALALALQARSVQREVILITDTRPRSALQLADNLLQLGFAHTLWLTSGHAVCAAAERLRADREALRAARGGGGGGGGSSSGGNGGGSSSGMDSEYAAKDGEDGAGGKGGGAAAAADADDPWTRTAAAAARRRWRRGLAAAAGSSTAAATGLLPPLNNSALLLRMVEAAALEDGSRAPFAAPPPAAAGASDALACAWYAQPFPAGFTGHRRLMMKRVMLMARAVRLGYNVLSLDTDVVVLRDPYPHLKAPPYGDMHMVVGKSVRGGGVVNTGVMYVQVSGDRGVEARGGSGGARGEHGVGTRRGEQGEEARRGEWRRERGAGSGERGAGGVKGRAGSS